jgi:flagellar biosynthesis/type III secretory pathway protein FliH
LDSVKKQKLFPDFSAPLSVEATDASMAEDSFQMSGNIWESLLREPSFESQLRVWIDKIAADRVATRVLEIEAQTRQAAHEAGYAAGLEAGKQALDASVAVLHDLSARIASEKEALLVQHEAHFSSALITVLENLAVPDAQKWVAQIEGLLQRFKAEFSEKARIEVRVSTEAWKVLQSAALKSVEGLRWAMKPDENIKGSAVQIDFGGVGMQLLPESLVEQWRAVFDDEIRKAG